MIVGGYRNGDLIDYTDPDVSFMYDLAAAAAPDPAARPRSQCRARQPHHHRRIALARYRRRYGGCEQPIETLPEEVLADCARAATAA
jgi:3-oxoacyl-[acyl-carrier-protein] synthase-3